MAQDMTAGKPTRLLLMFSLPILLGNIFQQLYNMVDSVVVGRGVGVDALSAVGASGVVYCVILGFGMGMAEGFAILPAQRYGARDYETLRKLIGSGILLTAITAILMTAGGWFFSRPLLRVMHTPEELLEEANRYMQILSAGICITLFYNFFAAILRALGDSRTPLLAMIAASVINVVLDILFVIVFRMGVSGAAAATLIAQGFSLFCCLAAIYKIPFLRFSRGDWKVEGGRIWALLRLGIPMALQNIIINIGAMILQYVVNLYGSLYIAAYTTGNKILNIIAQPPICLGVAMTSYTGQNMGARRLDRVRLGLRHCFWLTMGICAMLMIIVFLSADGILSLLLPPGETEVIAIGAGYVRIITLALPFLGLITTYRSALQGMGNTLLPMAASGVELLLRVSLPFVLPAALGFSMIGIAEASAWTGGGLFLVVSYYGVMRKVRRDDRSPSA